MADHDGMEKLNIPESNLDTSFGGKQLNAGVVTRAVAQVMAGLHAGKGHASIVLFTSTCAARSYLMRRRWRRIRQWIFLVYVLLGFLEPPPFCLAPDGPDNCPDGMPLPRYYIWPLPVLSLPVVLVPALFICICCVQDSVLAVCASSSGFRQGHLAWSMRALIDALYAAMAIASTVEIFVRLTWPSLLSHRIMPYRIFRHLLVAATSARVRQGSHLAGIALWETKHLYGYLLLLILVFSWIGLVLFRHADAGSDWDFETYGVSLEHLIVTLTSAAYPDVQTALANEAAPTFFFFFIFLVLGMFLLLNLILSQLYGAYHKALREHAMEGFHRREVAIDNTFTLLASSPYGDGELVVTCDAWRSFYSCWAPLVLGDHFASGRAEAIFDYVHSNSQTRNGLDQDEFCALVLVLSDPAVISAQAVARNQSLTRQVQRFRVPWYLKFLVDIALLSNLAMLAVDTATMTPSFNETQRFRAERLGLDCTLTLFTLLWIAELAVTAVSKGGIYRFWNHGNVHEHRFELLVVTATAIVDFWQVLPLPRPVWYYKLLFCARLLCALRIVLRRYMTNFVKSLLRIMPAMSLVLNLFMTIWLLSAQIGTQLYGGKLYRGSPVLDGENWSEMEYFSLNFNCLSSSLVTLFQQMVVNNWFVVMDACVIASGSTAYIYFISYYLVSITVMTNVFIAFLIESWQGQIQQMTTEEDIDPYATANMTTVAGQQDRNSRAPNPAESHPAVGSFASQTSSVASLRQVREMPCRERLLRGMFQDAIVQSLQDASRLDSAVSAARTNSFEYIRSRPGLAKALSTPAFTETDTPVRRASLASLQFDPCPPLLCADFDVDDAEGASKGSPGSVSMAAVGCER